MTDHSACIPGSDEMCPDCRVLWAAAQTGRQRRRHKYRLSYSHMRGNRLGPFARVKYEFHRFVVKEGRQ